MTNSTRRRQARNATNDSAQKAYFEQARRAKAAMELLEERYMDQLLAQRLNGGKNDTNWENVGTMQHLASQIEDLVALLEGAAR